MMTRPDTGLLQSGPGSGDSAELRDQAERIVIGAMLSGQAETVITSGMLTSSSFYRPHHNVVYAYLVAMYGEGVPCEPVALTKRLLEAKELRGQLGMPYLIECQQAAALAAGDPTYHARIVAEHAHRRRLAAVITRLSAVVDLEDSARRDEMVAQLVAELTAASGGRAAQHQFATGGQFVLDQPAQVPAVWGTGPQVLWSEGEPLMIVGPPGVGKTTLVGQLVAGRLGLLPSVLGLPVKPVKAGSGRVLYLACDRPRQIGRSLARTLRPEWRDILESRLAVWEGPPPRDLAQETGLLLSMARDAGADTVVVDSLKDVAVGLTDDTVATGYNRARQQAIAAGIEVVELHHQRKRGNDGAPPTTLADVYGSAWLTAGVGSVVLLWGEAGDPVVRLSHLKQPAAEFGPVHIVHDHATGLSTVQTQPDLTRAAATAPAGLTALDAAKLLFESTRPTRAQKEKARRRLDQMVTEGRLLASKGRADNGVITYHATTEEPGG